MRGRLARRDQQDRAADVIQLRGEFHLAAVAEQDDARGGIHRFHRPMEIMAGIGRRGRDARRFADEQAGALGGAERRAGPDAVDRATIPEQAGQARHLQRGCGEHAQYRAALECGDDPADGVDRQPAD